MILSKVHDALQSTLPELFDCAQPSNNDVRIRTPLLYPDGGLIEVFVYEQAGQLAVTDYGEALGWLSLQSTSKIRSPKRTNLINDICMTLGIRIENGQLQLTCNHIAELGEAVHRLAQAIVRVSDIYFTFSQPIEFAHTTVVQHPDTAKMEVKEWLDAMSFSFLEEVKHTGRSGITWTIDYEIETADLNHLVFYLHSSTRENAMHRRHQVFAGCSDLRSNGAQSLPNIYAKQLITLFDDANNIWNSEDYELMKPVSSPVSLSDKCKLESVLRPRAVSC